MRRTGLISLIAMLVFGSTFLTGQTRSKPPGAPPTPRQNLYGHLFYMIATVEGDADVAESRGERGRSQALRKHFQDKIGLKGNEAAILKSHATNANKAVRKQDEKARDVIAKIRKKTPGGKLKNGEKPPDVPKELLDMQAERDQMIIDHITGLQQALGQDAFQKIERFAQTQYEQAKVVATPKPKRPPIFVKP